MLNEPYLIALNQANLLAHLITDELDLGGMQTLLKLCRGQYALVEEQVDPAAQAVLAALLGRPQEAYANGKGEPRPG
jgi:trk system potassium uptake protein TrkA